MPDYALPTDMLTRGSLVLNERTGEMPVFGYEGSSRSYHVWIPELIRLESRHDTRYLTDEEQRIFRLARLKAGKRIDI